GTPPGREGKIDTTATSGRAGGRAVTPGTSSSTSQMRGGALARVGRGIGDGDHLFRSGPGALQGGTALASAGSGADVSRRRSGGRQAHAGDRARQRDQRQRAGGGLDA